MERFWKYRVDHWLFWIGTIGFHAFTRLMLIRKAGMNQFLLEIVVRNSLLAGLIYLNFLVLLPRFARQKKFGTYIVLLVIGLAAYVAGKNIHDVYLYGYVMGDASHRGFSTNTFYNLSIALFYLAFNVAMYLSKEWYIQRDLIRKIEIEKLNTELDYLKAQINPHFLFNSINTIYFQIDKENVPARDTLLTFSDMLRYQLYECNGNEIAVEKEIAYIGNYVELQRLRKDENYKIDFLCGPEVANFNIVPLLLLPFIENAFKHVSHGSQNAVRISLLRTDNQFHMNVFNTRDERSPMPGGIGLKNVQRRLDLLYPGRHELAIHTTGFSYEVDLKLTIG